MTFATLQGDINSIGYTASVVTNNFNRLFPKNQKQWQGTWPTLQLQRLL